MVMKKRTLCVKHMTLDSQLMKKLKRHIKKEANGVIMDGLMDKWLFSQHNQTHIKTYKPFLDTKTIVEDLV